jgi:hypothetical protein
MPAHPAALFEPDPDYVESPELKRVTEGLIARHERFGPLRDLRIAYLERLGEPSGEGESVLAQCQRATPLWRDYAHVDLVIWVWRAVREALEPRAFEALAAHEACHAFVTEKGTVKLLKHDLEEFHWVVRQYGPWDDAIRMFGVALTAHGDQDPAETVREMGRQQREEPIRLPAGRERRRPGSRPRPTSSEPSARRQPQDE